MSTAASNAPTGRRGIGPVGAPGRLGPVTAYAQAALLDPWSPIGVALSRRSDLVVGG